MADVRTVNKLVKEAFGRWYFGNHDPVIDPLCGDQVYGIKLKYISRRTFLPIPYIWENYSSIGQFTNNDGSSLKVVKEFEPQAKKYCELYKKETGKDVSLRIITQEKDWN